MPREIAAFRQRCGVDAKRANLVAVAAEEMAVNIIQYGGRRVHSIDINLTITPETLILRTRDNGIPFDPTHYESDAEAFEIHGIELIKRVSSRVQYLRVLDLNNTPPWRFRSTRRRSVVEFALADVISNRVQYLRVLDLNNTPVEIMLHPEAKHG